MYTFCDKRCELNLAPMPLEDTCFFHHCLLRCYHIFQLTEGFDGIEPNGSLCQPCKGSHDETPSLDLRWSALPYPSMVLSRQIAPMNGTLYAISYFGYGARRRTICVPPKY